MPPWVRVEVSIGSATTWGRFPLAADRGFRDLAVRFVVEDQARGHPEDHPGRVNGGHV